MNTALHKLFIDQLQDMYDAENRIVKALPKKIEAARSKELRQGLKKHLGETETHVERLEKIFEILDVEAKRSTCEATKGLIAEAEEIIKEFKDTEAGDAAIICAGQKIEHYEIATYGCLCTWAKEMGHTEVLELLKDSLSEEVAADESLSEAALSQANETANATR